MDARFSALPYSSQVAVADAAKVLASAQRVLVAKREIAARADRRCQGSQVRRCATPNTCREVHGAAAVRGMIATLLPTETRDRSIRLVHDAWELRRASVELRRAATWARAGRRRAISGGSDPSSTLAARLAEILRDGFPSGYCVACLAARLEVAIDDVRDAAQVLAAGPGFRLVERICYTCASIRNDVVAVVAGPSITLSARAIALHGVTPSSLVGPTLSPEHVRVLARWLEEFRFDVRRLIHVRELADGQGFTLSQ
jgi:hypothetical protein